MPFFGDALAAEVGRRHGAPVQMMQLRHGILDEASISVIASATVREIGRLAERSADIRRFRPNLVVRSTREDPFEETEWVGGVLAFGEADDASAVAVTMRDLRCAMVDIDPDGGRPAPEVMKACVRAKENYVGIYCTVTRLGRLAVGQTISLVGSSGQRNGAPRVSELEPPARLATRGADLRKRLSKGAWHAPGLHSGTQCARARGPTADSIHPARVETSRGAGRHREAHDELYGASTNPAGPSAFAGGV